MKNYKVYKLICPNGKIYIGKTNRPIKKRFGHGCNYQNNPPFYDYIREVGWENIKIDIVAEDLNDDEAKIIENENIEKYQSYLPSKGFNRSKGQGTLGMKRTEDEKRRISEALKGEKCYWYGKGKRRSTKIEKTHEINTNWVSCRPVIQMDLDCNVIKEYPAMSIASYENNILKSAICNCCSGKKLTAGGYKWKYKEKENGK